MVAKRMAAINNDIIKLQKQVSDKDNLRIEKTLINKMLTNTEQNLIDLRELFYVFNFTSSEDNMRRYFRESAEIIGIDIEQLEMPYVCYKLTLPFLLPNQRKKWGVFKDTIGKSVYYAIDEFQKTNKITPIYNSSVSFVSYYSSLHKRYIHDNDNQEARDVLNILNNMLILDDNSLICDIHYYSKLTSSHSKTEIYITEADCYINFYKDVLLNLEKKPEN